MSHQANVHNEPHDEPHCGPHLARDCPGQHHAQGRMPVDVLQERLLVLGRNVLGNLQRRQLCVTVHDMNDQLIEAGYSYTLARAIKRKPSACGSDERIVVMLGASAEGQILHHIKQAPECPACMLRSGQHTSRLSTQSYLCPNHCGTVRSAKCTSSVASSMFSAPSYPVHSMPCSQARSEPVAHPVTLHTA